MYKKLMYKEFKSLFDHDKVFTRRLIHGAAILVGVMAIGVSLSLFSKSAEAMRQQSGIAAERITIALQIPGASATEQPHHALDANTTAENSFKVKKGDTLSSIFARAGLGPQHVQEIMDLGKDAKKLTRLVPGQEFVIKLNSDNELQSLVHHIDDRSWVTVARNESDQLGISVDSRDYEHRVAFAKGTIRSSLFETAKEAGLSESLTMDLAYIFGWDIDFALDIREDDSFIVMYEELYLDGEKVRDGNILAAEFVNQGKTYKTIRYTDPKDRHGYYSPDGRSMKKAFLRTPVDFTRISSRYGKRHHPVLNTIRKHNGVDYAAPRGTPIKASGDGKIIFRGKKGGYGKTVIIDHGNGYRTLYAHMNSFNRKAGWGKHVRQGQVVGYVGSTGRATGPHLHYEFQVNGRHRNPLTVRLPDAAPIAKAYRDDFEAKIQPLLAQIDFIKNANIAFSSL